MEWRNEFTPAWQTYMLFTIGYVLRLRAARKQLADAANDEHSITPYSERLFSEHKAYY